MPGSETIAVIFRIHYKVLNTLAPKVKQITKPGKTILVETNLLSSNIATNRILKWEEINFPQNWLLTSSIPPRPVVETDLDQIIQSEDGEVEVRFNPKIITRISSSRNSNSNFENQSIKSGNYTRRDKELEVQGIKISNSSIAHPIYERPNPGSPTQSDMDFNI